jgi:hypothetical protein
MPLEMNPEVRAKWTAALRSGEYRQGFEALHSATEDGDKFCCLGVLCDLAMREGVVTADSPSRSDDDVNAELWSYGGRVDYLPEAVRDWAGLDDTNPQVPVTDEKDEPLGWLNDHDWSFAQIADAIDGGEQA